MDHLASLGESSGPPVIGAAPQNRLYDFSNLDVLVVDDCRFMRSLLAESLHALGVGRIRRAKDGRSGWMEARNGGVDIVITDWEMAPEDGRELVRRIRTGPDTPDRYMPIIMLTAYTEYRQVMEARDLGVTEFLAKPVSARAIYARLVSVIENPRPFVYTGSYFGPCRRRRNDPNYKGPERRRTELDEVMI